jgi:hypothetical protein
LRASVFSTYARKPSGPARSGPTHRFQQTTAVSDLAGSSIQGRPILGCGGSVAWLPDG